MATTDSLPVPRKNVAFRVHFDLRLNTGALNTGATGLDSELSKDDGTFVDVTDEAHEVATASGHYYLDLTNTEMNADSVLIQIKSTNTNNVTRTIIMHPAEDTDIPVNVTAFGGVAGTFASGIPSASLTTASRDATAGAVWDVATSGHVAAGSFGAGGQPTDGGTAQAGGASTITLKSGASAVNNFYNLQLLEIVAGTGAGQSEYITAYVGATKVATMAAAWHTQPDATSVYIIKAGGTIPGASAPTATQNADAVWNATRSGYLTPGSMGYDLGSDITRISTAQAGGASTITLDAGASATNDLYRYSKISTIGGTGAGQGRQISGYVGSSKVATVSLPWTTQPDATTVFVITPLGVDAATVAAIAVGVWAATRAGNGTAGTFGEYVSSDAVRLAGNATAANNAKSAFDGATGFAFTGCTMPTVTTLTGNTAQTGDAFARLGAPAGASVSADVAAVKADTAGIKTSTDAMAPKLGTPAGASISADIATANAAITALNNVSQAQVKTQVVAALNTDTYGEPGQGAPAATTTLVAKINYLYKAWRNKTTQDATTYKLLANDGVTVDQKSTVSDAAGTFTRGVVSTGP